MDPPVFQQGLQGVAGYLPFYGIEGGDQDGIGRFVDHQRGSGHGFEASNVATLPADDPSLHVFAWKVHNCGGSIGHWCGADPLHGGDHAIQRHGFNFKVGLVAQLLLQTLQLTPTTALNLRYQLGLDIALRHVADGFKFLQVGLLFGSEFGGKRIQLLCPLHQ